MNSRRLAASLALSAAVLIGATGCTFITNQATEMPYSASDGVNAPESGPVVARNVMIIANEDGTAGNLVAGLVNTDKNAPQTITITVEGLAPVTVTVPADSLQSLGGNVAPVPLAGFQGQPGGDVLVTFTSDGASAVTAHVPILDGTLPYYTELAP